MKKTKHSLILWDDMPYDMEKYLRNYGYHFNRKLYIFAVSKMYKESNGKKEKIEPVTKEQVEELLKKYNITLDNDEMYDSAYLHSMIMSDFYGKSIKNEQDVAMHIKCMIDDVDKPDGYIFNRWYGDMCFAGIPIDWEDFL